MTELISAFLLTFAALFPIVNPIESAPFFLALTSNITQAERSALARVIAINGFALLLGSMVLGPWLLEFFGIELPVVRIAGGLVVTALGWKLLTQEQWSDHADAEVQPAGGRKIGSFYPLTMPLTVGPGSISVAITHRQQEAGGRFSPCRHRAARPGRLRPASSPSPRASTSPIDSPAISRAARGDGSRSRGAAVGIHSHVHRHRDHLERLQRADAASLTRRLRSGCAGSRKTIADDRLRLLEDAAQVIGAAKALGVDLVDLFRPRRTGSEPTGRVTTFTPSSAAPLPGAWLSIGGDRLAGQGFRTHLLGGQPLRICFWALRRRRIDPLERGIAELTRQVPIQIARIAAGARRHLRGQQTGDDAVLVGAPCSAIELQERGAGALLAAETERSVRAIR